jgi:hypothetical protein
MERRAATNVWPTAPTTITLSKAMTIAAGVTFTPTQAYTRYDRGSGACTEQAEGVISPSFRMALVLIVYHHRATQMRSSYFKRALLSAAL